MSPKRNPAPNIGAMLAERVIGQPEAVRAIVPYVQMYQAGLNPEGRPAGVFLLLGPTGTGKTHTVEALAHVIHGSRRNVLRIDCGEYQMEHEVAKLIGAPPGYLGHRETQPVLTQAKLNNVMTDRANLAIVLLDEIEKAAPSMQRLLLGVLDNGVLRLGDNTAVNFERTLIFMTSNLGVREMDNAARAGFGFARATGAAGADFKRMDRAARAAVKRKLPPEFVNRIDAMVTYRPLSADAMNEILDMEMAALAAHICRRLGDRAFCIRLLPNARRFLLERGTSARYGARELKRVINREIMQPLAAQVAAGRIPAGSVVHCGVTNSGTGDGESIKFTVKGEK
jgi:ATP-dependent Clp protease ATP-binding subunit ClpA